MMPPKNKPQKAVVIPLKSEECVAKTYKQACGTTIKGRTVLDHCQIVGKVAQEILARIPLELRTKLFPIGTELIASLHDIGKVSPTFQEKIRRAIDGYSANSLEELRDAKPNTESEWGGHAGVSFATLKNMSVKKFIPEIVGMHHGYSTNHKYTATCEKFGGDNWENNRQQLVKELVKYFNCEYPILNQYQARVVAGLTSVSDWIGSGVNFEDPAIEWDDQSIKNAVDDAGLVPPEFEKNLSFYDIFDFVPHDIQSKFITNTNQEGVYILEAPMGIGKTEAALYAAYSMICSGKANGLYFALPTQLTSNKIHDRINKYLQKILKETSPYKEALLIHSNSFFDKIGEEGTAAGSWFSTAKRAILAPFGVGTIDQVLMSVLNVKHGFVRSFGLVGKVVILDEVHSYDTYTGTILDELVKQLRELACTVIILSATLTKERRNNLLSNQNHAGESSNDYPLITSLYTKNSIYNEIAVDQVSGNLVNINLITDDKIAVNEVLKRAESKQQVLWIENTVKEAQEIYSLLAARAETMGVECGLLHSRFLKCDREVNEEKWVKLFDKNCLDERRGKNGRILVGTQVLEQSLDIDADFMVTRFCPTDMLLQRLGRLWRHKNTQRPLDTKCEALLLKDKIFGATARVYNEYILRRSLEVWENYTVVRLPNDIRCLIENTYSRRNYCNTSADEYDKKMGRLQNDLKVKCDKLKIMALSGVSNWSNTLAEEEIGTRYSEIDRTECLLIRNLDLSKNDKESIVTLLSGERIILPKNIKSIDRKLWKGLANKLRQNIVMISSNKNLSTKKELNWLKDYFYLGNNESEEALIVVAKVNIDDNIILLNGSSTELKYNKKLGYQK